MKGERFTVAGLTLGGYQIGERIGAGGMAAVYRGVQTSLNREVAIKVLPAHYAMDPSFVERFKQEAISVASLRHPNILSVFDYGEQNGIIYMVTEYLPGGTLEQRLGSPLALDQVITLATPLASALDYAHSRGIVHRDIKPANVLFTASGEPILSDFGLARLLQSAERLTHSGAALGTPEYMAPEQATGAEIGPGADIYAFGVLLFEMLTGEVPFPGETPVAIILAHLHQPPPSLRSINPTVSPEVEVIILTCLAKSPADRYPNATAVVRALDATRRGSVPAMDLDMPSAPILIEAPLNPSDIFGTPTHGNQTIEYGELRVDLSAERLMWNGQGMERARELIQRRVDEMRRQGWELAGSIRDPGVLQQGQSLRGVTIRSAVLFLRRVSQ